MGTIFVIIVLSLVEAIGDSFLKLAGAGPRYIDTKWFVAGGCMYLIAMVAWFFVIKHAKLSSIGIIYAVTMALVLVAIGVFYFHEKLDQREIFGVVAGLISIVLLSRFL